MLPCLSWNIRGPGFVLEVAPVEEPGEAQAGRQCCPTWHGQALCGRLGMWALLLSRPQKPGAGSESRPSTRPPSAPGLMPPPEGAQQGGPGLSQLACWGVSAYLGTGVVLASAVFSPSSPSPGPWAAKDAPGSDSMVTLSLAILLTPVYIGDPPGAVPRPVASASSGD